jgi:hypothetical protein
VESEPRGVSVLVDGAAAGRTPVTVAELAPGPHTVTLAAASGRVERRVEIEAGATASIFVSLAPEGATLAGWVRVNVPFEVAISEDGKLMGTSAAERLMLPAGRHTLQLSSEALGYTAAATVAVTPGSTTTLVAELPMASINVNAQPWAEVFIDGQPVGTTPLANVPVQIGPHDVVLRNPALGERAQRILVRYGAPNRLSVDLRK